MKYFVMAVAALHASAAFSAPRFSHSQSDGVISSDQDGRRKIINGIDVWLSGGPARPYVIIGAVDDIDKGGELSRKPVSIAAAVRFARQNGGEAIERTFYHYPNREIISSWAVLKYVSESH